MLIRATQIFVVGLLIAFGAFGVSAQNAENNTPASMRQGEKEEQPKNVREMLEKMRIAKDKKEHDEMIERGEEVLRIAEQLDKSYAAHSGFTADDLARLATIEQKVKKIRNELGGKDDDEPLVESVEKRPSAFAEAFKTFRSTTAKLVDELKKTSRFSISAVAIESSNVVMKLARFLRIGK